MLSHESRTFFFSDFFLQISPLYLSPLPLVADPLNNDFGRRTEKRGSRAHLRAERGVGEGREHYCTLLSGPSHPLHPLSLPLDIIRCENKRREREVVVVRGFFALFLRGISLNPSLPPSSFFHQGGRMAAAEREGEKSKWLSAFKGNLIYFVNMLLKPVLCALCAGSRNGRGGERSSFCHKKGRGRRKGFPFVRSSSPPFHL